MTMLAVTVAADRIVVSQDNLIVRQSAAYKKHAAEYGKIGEPGGAAATCYPGGGGANTVTAVGSSCKIFALPQLNAVVTATGDLGFLAHWWLTVAQNCFGDILELDRHAPALLNQVRQQRGTNEAIIIVHAGWSRRAGAMVARAYPFDQDFKSVEIPIGATFGAAPDPDDPAYEEIAGLWAAAGRGEHMERLHCALYGGLARAYVEGRLAPGVAIGGGLVHCIVAPTSIRMHNADLGSIEADQMAGTEEGEQDPGEVIPLPDLSGLADVAAE